MQEFVKICLLDKTLGDTVLKIFRAVISKFWNILLIIKWKEVSKNNVCVYINIRHLELHIWALVLGNIFCADQASKGKILGKT